MRLGHPAPSRADPGSFIPPPRGCPCPSSRGGCVRGPKGLRGSLWPACVFHSARPSGPGKRLQTQNPGSLPVLRRQGSYLRTRVFPASLRTPPKVACRLRQPFLTIPARGCDDLTPLPSLPGKAFPPFPLMTEQPFQISPPWETLPARPRGPLPPTPFPLPTPLGLQAHPPFRMMQERLAEETVWWGLPPGGSPGQTSKWAPEASFSSSLGLRGPAVLLGCRGGWQRKRWAASLGDSTNEAPTIFWTPPLGRGREESVRALAHP